MNLLSVAVVVVVVVVAGLVAGSPTSYFGEKDGARLAAVVKAAAGADGIFGGSLSDAYFGVNSLAALRDLPPAASSPLCAQLLKTPVSAPATSVFFAASIAKVLGCKSSGVDIAKAKATLEAALESGKIDEMLSAVEAVIALNIKSDFDSSVLVGVVDKAKALAEDDGLFKNSESDTDATFSNTARAYRLFHLARLHLSVGADEDKAIAQVSQGIENVLDLGTEVDKSLMFAEQSDPQSAVRVTSALLTSIIKLSPTALSKERIVSIATFLLEQKNAVGSLADIHYLLEALRALHTNSVGQVLVLTVPKDTLLTSSKGKEGYLKVSVTDIFGKFAAPMKVFLSKATSTSASASLISSQELFPETDAPDNTFYHFNMLAAKPEYGSYTMEFSANPIGSNKDKFIPVSSAVRQVKLVSSIQVADLKIAVTDRAADAGTPISVEFGSTHEEISADVDQRIKVSFSVRNSVSSKGVTVQQAFVRLASSSDPSKEAFIVATYDGRRYTAAAKLADLADSLGHQTGVYALSVIIGDTFISNPVSWHAANIHVTFPARAQPAKPLSVLPEIHHVFRQPDKRAPSEVALAFTGVTLAPALIFIFGLLAIGANISKLFGSAFLYGIGFHACIAGVAYVVVTFWFSLTILDAAKYLLMMGVPTFIFGYLALSHHKRH